MIRDHRPLASAWLTALLLLLLSQAAHADLKVVATVPTLAAIAKAIGGPKVEVSSLALHTQDPHFVDAKPSLALRLNRADLLLSVGLGLESGWLPTLRRGARNPKVLVGADGSLDCSRLARLLDKPANVDRSGGDIHPGGNPHYLYDPRQAAHVAIGVAARMATLDQENASSYHANLRTFLRQLHAERRRLQKRMKPHRGKPFIAYHRSWAYLAEWLTLVPVAYLEPKPGIVPSPAHVAKVIGIARRKNARVLVQEAYYPDATAKLVVRKIGGTLVRLPGGVNQRAGEKVTTYYARLVRALESGFAQ